MGPYLDNFDEVADVERAAVARDAKVVEIEKVAAAKIVGTGRIEEVAEATAVTREGVGAKVVETENVAAANIVGTGIIEEAAEATETKGGEKVVEKDGEPRVGNTEADMVTAAAGAAAAGEQSYAKNFNSRPKPLNFDCTFFM